MGSGWSAKRDIDTKVAPRIGTMKEFSCIVVTDVRVKRIDPNIDPSKLYFRLCLKENGSESSELNEFLESETAILDGTDYVWSNVDMIFDMHPFILSEFDVHLWKKGITVEEETMLFSGSLKIDITNAITVEGSFNGNVLSTSSVSDQTIEMIISYMYDEEFRVDDTTGTAPVAIDRKRLRYYHDIDLLSMIECCKLAKVAYLGYANSESEGPKRSEQQFGQQVPFYKGSPTNEFIEFNYNGKLLWEICTIYRGLGETLEAFDLKLLKYLHNGMSGMSGFIAATSDFQELVIAFRGHYDATDMKRDLDPTLIPWVHDENLSPEIRAAFQIDFLPQVMIGPYTQFCAKREIMMNIINTVIKSYSVSKITIIGHGLGGVEAHFAAVAISEAYIYKTDTFHLPFDIEMMTFGSPRTGNEDFKQWSRHVLSDLFCVRAYRFVNGKDLIPMLPPPICRLVHCGGEIVRLLDTTDQSELTMKQRLHNRVNDHLLSAYLEHLERLLDSGITSGSFRLVNDSVSLHKQYSL
jgi:hypothetical protein